MQILRILTATLLYVGLAIAGPILLVVPNVNASSPGNATDTLSGPVIFRSQEVFGSGQFAGIPGSLLITEFAFRTAPGTGSASISMTSMDIYLSTTLFSPNTGGGATLLTNNFANNLGADETHVYSGPLSLSSPGCAGPAVCPFDLVITLSTPFLYNPSQGRLLMDIQGTFGSRSGVVDAVSFPPTGGAVASLSSDGTTPTGTVATQGDIVEFGYILVTPEPASFALLLGGLAGFCAIRNRRRSRTSRSVE